MKKSAIFAWLLAAIIILANIVRLFTVQTVEIPETGFFSIISVLLGVAIFSTFGVMAALIVSRRPNNVIGWLLFLPATTAILNVEPYIRSFDAAPEPPPIWLLFSLWYSISGWLQLIFPLFIIPVLFPTGRPPSPRWRWVIYAGVSMCIFFLFLATFVKSFSAADLGRDWAVANPIGFIEIGDIEAFLGIWGFGLLTMAILSVASLIVRYRRAAVVERKQIQWLLYACIIFGFFYIGAYPLNTIWSETIWNEVANLLWQISLIGIPASIAIAILRYRLFDIDLIIRRTLQYGLISLLLGLVYFGMVVLFGQVFQSATGQQSPLVIVISTLVIAALFNPLRRRIQEWIDRRFYRSRYNADQALASFSVAVRNQVELDSLASLLAEAASESLQPESILVWIRKDAKQNDLAKKGIE